MRACAIISAGLLALALFAGPASAHGGGQDKYGGHIEKAIGAYHCHGTGAKREACDMRARVTAQRERLNKLEMESSNHARELAAALRAHTEAKREAAKLRGALRTARALANRAVSERDAAKRARDNALRDMREAELRAKGKGPAVSSRCRDGVTDALDSGWRFSAAEKAALRRACLN